MSSERIKFDRERNCFVDKDGNLLKTNFEYLTGKKAITIFACHGEHKEAVDVIVLPSLAQSYVLGMMSAKERHYLEIVKKCGLEEEFKNQVNLLRILYKRAER